MNCINYLKGSSGSASRALLQQSDCVESASEQDGVLGACSKSRSGLKTNSKSSNSKHRSVGSRVQLTGVRGLASPPEPPHGGSVSATCESSSCLLLPGKHYPSLSTGQALFCRSQRPLQEMSLKLCLLRHTAC